MPLNTAYLALGSNVGQRLQQMRLSLSRLREKGVTTVIASPVYENRAVGMGETDPFLNAVVQVQTALDPKGLLNTCLAVEAELGRIRSEVWAPRTIDMDLLVYETVHMNTVKLQLPHPRITERDFVLQPFADIAPDFELHGKSIRAWLQELPTIELNCINDKLM